MMYLKVLELYSGIGGMHCGLNESNLQGHVVAAVDINNIANEVYCHNFPKTILLNRNIQSLKPEEIKKMEVNCILMSPPCQPFTRNGKYLDENDARTNSFIYLLEILSDLDNIECILLENVKGFECSSVRKLFLDKLKECDFTYQEFLLCPSTAGVPNSRLRYYCIARRGDKTWNFSPTYEIMTKLPDDYGVPFKIAGIIEDAVSDKYLVPDKLLTRANIMDICYKESARSCCFTKAYSHYIEGMGSVIVTDNSPETVEKCFAEANMHDVGSIEFVNKIKPLKIRFFTPKEILTLMEFPKSYHFPDCVTTKQCYRLLGNSVNVKVISELLKLLSK